MTIQGGTPEYEAPKVVELGSIADLTGGNGKGNGRGHGYGRGNGNGGHRNGSGNGNGNGGNFVGGIS